MFHSPHPQTLPAPHISVEKPPSPSTQGHFPEEGDLDRPFSDKTWPRASSNAKLFAKLSESFDPQDGSEGSTTNPSPKSQGTPTHYESVEERVGEESLHGSSGEHSSSLHSNSDSLLIPNHMPGVHPDSPQYCIKLPRGATAYSGTPNGRSAGRSESTELLMVTTGLQVKSRRMTGSETAPPSNDTGLSDMTQCNTESAHVLEDSRSKSTVHKPAKQGQDNTDGISSYIERMRRLGHRRASSAPIKEVGKGGSFARQQEGEEAEVFMSPGAERSSGPPVNRGRQMVSRGGEGVMGRCSGVEWSSSPPRKTPLSIGRDR